jgi:16S rRNA (cytosine1402-N4)-methyltransferase
MLDRCLALLAPALAEPGAVFVDATVGLGGHSAAVLEAFPQVHVIGLDRDVDALEVSRIRLVGPRVTLVHAVFDQLPTVLADLGLPRIQGILFDLGVSSLQLDQVLRGFSYSQDAPLDMRMDQGTGPTAADVLNTYAADELATVLWKYGEERFSRRIAALVVKERAAEPFENSARLVDVIRRAIPAATRRTGGNPAKRTFQALRIEVNGELAALTAALPAAIDALAVGGRIVVMSYQSLEDRLVKMALTAATTSTAPHGLPVVPESLAPRLRILTRGAEVAVADEIERNPRATSVRLRAAERIREAA